MKKILYNLATDKYRGCFFAIPKLFLLLLSFVYGVFIRVLSSAISFRARTLKCKVISVGNITLGGTGKTSLVKLIALYLQNKKHKVAIISRGYKKLSMTMGDEPEMLLKSLGDIPVIVDKDRFRGSRRASDEYGVDTVIFDDGLQQWGIKKSLEIVAVNALEGFGNRQMLPRGLLREPLSSLKRADVFILTKTNLSGNLEGLKRDLAKLSPGALIVESAHKPVGFYDLRKPQDSLGLSYLKGKRVALFSGIGDPDSFTNLVKSLGAKVSLELKFADHHNYSDEEISEIIDKAKTQNLNVIVTTEKDAARLSDERIKLFGSVQILVLRIELEITNNEGEFLARLLSVYSF